MANWEDSSFIKDRLQRLQSGVAEANEAFEDGQRLTSSFDRAQVQVAPKFVAALRHFITSPEAALDDDLPSWAAAEIELTSIEHSFDLQGCLNSAAAALAIRRNWDSTVASKHLIHSAFQFDQKSPPVKNSAIAGDSLRWSPNQGDGEKIDLLVQAVTPEAPLKTALARAMDLVRYILGVPRFKASDPGQQDIPERTVTTLYVKGEVHE